MKYRKMLDPLRYREKHQGVIGVNCKIPIKDESILSVVYTPGVAEPCLKIAEDPVNSFRYTCRGNTVAIITDGSRVLGFGNLGPKAAIPVMEAKSVMFKTFGGIDAFPICIDTEDTEEIIKTVVALGPTFGAICLEDISAPKCFTIQHHLREAMGVSVFHNDQHASAVEVFAALHNSLKIVRKKFDEAKIVICGAGAAGIAVANVLVQAGVKDIILTDTSGVIHRRRLHGMNWAKCAIARKTNPRDITGSLDNAVDKADVLIGFSEGKVFTADLIQRMGRDPIVFALAVPEPEILPDLARKGGARIVATASSDYPNQLDTALVFPGFFRGLLDSASANINFAMLRSAALALAGLVPDSELNEENIIPGIFDFDVAPAIAEAVAKEAVLTKEANIAISPEEVRDRLNNFIYDGRFPVPDGNGDSELSVKEQSLRLHERYKGIIEIKSKIPVKDTRVLTSFYLPPDVAIPPEIISKDPSKVYDLTCKRNLVAVISDGSAVLGLGNIGPWAALPVMEGKCALFHTLAGVEAFPICLASQDPDELIAIIKNISPVLGGINLEDISSPRCFEIEKRLKETLDIPVFHDDQHGTAVVVLAGLINALKLTRRKAETIKVVVNGAGAAAIAISKLLLTRGIKNLTLCDRTGIIYKGRQKNMNSIKEEISKESNPERVKGDLTIALKDADVFIGVSAPKTVTVEMIKAMKKDPIIFALSNPTPEIMPDQARSAGAFVVATGRSDFPNQVNNSLIFPGIFRGALDARVTTINDQMKIAAAEALADLVGPEELTPDHIIPKGLDYRVPPVVAAAAAAAAISSGVARVQVDPEQVKYHTRRFIYEGELDLT